LSWASFGGFTRNSIKAEHSFMAIKNYYATLGVSRNETLSGIRAAYREAVRRTHPDHAGPQAAAAFQEIVEAHSVLSDPDRRRQYNHSLTVYERERSQLGLLHQYAAERDARSIFADAHSVHPSFEALAERLLRNFTGRGVPKAERPEGLSVEVILTPEEAAQGGVLSIGVPVHAICRACAGTGNDWLFPCPHCRGQGAVSTVQAVQVRIPQSLSLGVTPEVSLEMLGINNLFLKIRMRVSNEQFY
jgi:molecular chaperone DnaJ